MVSTSYKSNETNKNELLRIHVNTHRHFRFLLVIMVVCCNEPHGEPFWLWNNTLTTLVHIWWMHEIERVSKWENERHKLWHREFIAMQSKFSAWAGIQNNIFCVVVLDSCVSMIFMLADVLGVCVCNDDGDVVANWIAHKSRPKLIVCFVWSHTEGAEFYFPSEEISQIFAYSQPEMSLFVGVLCSYVPTIG